MRITSTSTYDWYPVVHWTPECSVYLMDLPWTGDTKLFLCPASTSIGGRCTDGSGELLEAIFAFCLRSFLCSLNSIQRQKAPKSVSISVQLAASAELGIRKLILEPNTAPVKRMWTRKDYSYFVVVFSLVCRAMKLVLAERLTFRSTLTTMSLHSNVCVKMIESSVGLGAQPLCPLPIALIRSVDLVVLPPWSLECGPSCACE